MIASVVAMVVLIAGSHFYGRGVSQASWETRSEVVRLYLEGRLNPDGDGFIELPASIATDSLKHVYVTERCEDRFVLFRTWTGKGGNIDGYLYSTNRALEVGQEVSINRPSPRGVTEDELPVVDSLGGRWYRVFYNLD